MGAIAKMLGECNGSRGKKAAEVKRCHGKNVMTPIQGGPWQPWKESFHVHWVFHNDAPSWWVMTHHDDSLWWSIMIHHDAASRDSPWLIMTNHWFVMMNHDDESWWFMNHHAWIMMRLMNHHCEAPWGPEGIPFRVVMALFAMGALTFSQATFCHGCFFYGSHYIQVRTFKMGWCNS